MSKARFWQLDPDLFRRLPTARKAAAALAAYWQWQTDASVLEAAAALGIPASTARRWAVWLAEDARGTTSKPTNHRLARSSDRAVRGAVRGATNGASGTGFAPFVAPYVAPQTAPSSIDSDIREGERDTNGAPSPLVSQIKNETEDSAAVILAAVYIARTTRRRVTTAEAHARITEDLRSGAYTSRDLAAYIDATPHIDAYPRELAAAVTTYLNHINVRRNQRRLLAAWSALRRRLANVRLGDTAWPIDAARSTPWTVVEVDAEAGSLSLRRRTATETVYAAPAGIGGALAAAIAERRRENQDRQCVEEQTLAGPDALAGWALESEMMPLFAAGSREPGTGNGSREPAPSRGRRGAG